MVLGQRHSVNPGVQLPIKQLRYQFCILLIALFPGFRYDPFCMSENALKKARKLRFDGCVSDRDPHLGAPLVSILRNFPGKEIVLEPRFATVKVSPPDRVGLVHRAFYVVLCFPDYD